MIDSCFSARKEDAVVFEERLELSGALVVLPRLVKYASDVRWIAQPNDRCSVDVDGDFVAC